MDATAFAEELSGRWQRLGAVMAAQDIDLVIALDLSRDEVMLSTQRWLTGYVPIGMPAAVLIPCDGAIELIAPMVGKPAAEFYDGAGLPVERTVGFSIPLIAARVAARAPRRIGIVETLCFPAALATALAASTPGAELVDITPEILKLRLVKTPFEIERIGRSAAIADQVWAQVGDIFKVGRRTSDVLADVDHLVRLGGAETGFHLILPLPFQGMPMEVLADPSPIRADGRYLLEISPRYQGYYSQLTIPVTARADDTRVHDAHAAIVAAKAMAAPLMVPGADLTQISGTIAAFLEERGYAMTSASLGHFCGMGLEEPRHAPDLPFLLEEGMSLIFHPVLAEPDFRSLMRAETYLITPDGARKFNQYAGGVLEIS